MSAKDLSVKEVEEALSVLEIALIFERELTIPIIFLSEKYKQGSILAGLSLCIRMLQAEKYPDLLNVTKKVPRKLLQQYKEARHLLASAEEMMAAKTNGTLQ